MVTAEELVQVLKVEDDDLSGVIKQPCPHRLQQCGYLCSQETVEDTILNTVSTLLAPGGHESDVKVPDSGVELLSDILLLGEAPPVEDVRGESGKHATQSSDPARLIRTSLTTPDMINDVKIKFKS